MERILLLSADFQDCNWLAGAPCPHFGGVGVIPWFLRWLRGYNQLVGATRLRDIPPGAGCVTLLQPQPCSSAQPMVTPQCPGRPAAPSAAHLQPPSAPAPPSRGIWGRGRWGVPRPGPALPGHGRCRPHWSGLVQTGPYWGSQGRSGHPPHCTARLLWGWRHRPALGMGQRGPCW